MLRHGRNGTHPFFRGQHSATQFDASMESEADHIADRITRTDHYAGPGSFFRPASLAQIPPAAHGVNGPVLRKAQSPASGGDGPVTTFLGQQSSGIPLPKSTRKFFEPRLGYDFSSVRIHRNEEAAHSAQRMNALAYTVGNDIVFNENQFSPETENGKKLLAHELVHVVQQQPGRLQRKEIPPEHRDTEKMLKSAKLFWDDFHETFASYVDAGKISGTGFDSAQQEAIHVDVSGNGDIDITFGQAFLDEKKPLLRKAMIKAEIIDKHLSYDRFEDLAVDPTHSRLQQINPPYRAGMYCQLNCPATAASLSEYLQTGTVNKAYCNPALEQGKGYGFDVSMNTMSTATDWKQAFAAMKKLLQKHGEFVVVEARRSARQQQENNLTEYHYFTVVNVKGTLFAIDAFGGGIVSGDVDAYITRLKATYYGMMQGIFRVKLVL